MEQHVKAIQLRQLDETIKNLQSRGFVTHVCEHKADVLPMLDTLIKDHSKVAHGGSVTLEEIGVIPYLQSRDITYYDRYKPGLDEEAKQACMREAFHCDHYLMSTSAITLDGQLYNIDGNGNRLASLIFGPKQVLIVVGLNKLVPDLDAARQRMRTLSAPANAQRLQCPTPCVKTGYCVDCRSRARICAQEVITSWQREENRIQIIFVKEELGY